MAKIKLENLKKFCKEALVKEGMKEEYAELTARVLSETLRHQLPRHQESV